MEWASPYLFAIVVTWLVAHIIKYGIDLLTPLPETKREKVFRSGGMPSAHVATMTALWTVILVLNGWTSAIFALASLMLLIIAHDAVRVRRASGEQGKALALLIDETKSKIPHPRAPKGHTPMEVAAGFVLGIIIGLLITSLF